jgi:hypothetical protein
MIPFDPYTGGFANCCGAQYSIPNPLGVSLRFDEPFEDLSDPCARLDQITTNAGPIYFKFRKAFGEWKRGKQQGNSSVSNSQIYHGAMQDVLPIQHYPINDPTGQIYFRFLKPRVNVGVLIAKDYETSYKWYIETPAGQIDLQRAYSSSYKGRTPFTFKDYWDITIKDYSAQLPMLRKGLGDALVYESEYFFNANHPEQLVPTLKLFVFDYGNKETK